MSQRVSFFTIAVVSLATACGSDPPPPPASPPPVTASAQVSVAPTSAPQPAPQVAAPPPTTATAPATATMSTTDVATCIRHIDAKVTDACKSCVATSCLSQITAVGAACPDFTKCICDGKAMAECAPSMMSPSCMQPGMAVGACMRQSCAAQCPTHAAATPAANPTMGAPPAATDSDPCTALTACCAQVPGGAPPSCSQVVATRNAQACTSLLTVFRNTNRCH